METFNGLPVLDMEFNEEEFRKGAYMMSLVKEPATESTFFKFSADKAQLDKIEFKFAVQDEEQGLITGVIMMADKKILRKMPINGVMREFYIRFKKDVVKKMAFKFMRDLNANNVNIEHDQTKIVSDVSMVESWLFDESRGMKVPDYVDATDGSWLGSMEVKNPEVREKIQNGELAGFSLEGNFGMSLNFSNEMNIFTDEDKTLLLSHLSDKGQKKPDNWKLIHSELCSPDEADFDVEELLTALSAEHKLAVSTVSNPNEDSRLDKGVIKVRYRYVLNLEHIGEPEIEVNTREFCETLIRQDKIYRREDINIMSFRGTNPIAKTNYSIFRLQGHWNCRHAWSREIYLIEEEDKSVENNPLVSETTLLSKIQKMKNNKLVTKIKALFSDNKKEVTQEEVEAVVAEVEAEEHNFVDVKSGDNIMRIDGEIAEGTSVLWVDEAGVTSDVPDGEYPLVEEKKVVTVKDGVITVVADVEATAEDAEDAEPAEDLKAELSAFKEGLMKDIGEAIDAKLSKNQDEIFDKIKKLPAFEEEDVDGKFTSHTPEEDTDRSIGQRLQGDYVHRKKD